MVLIISAGFPIFVEEHAGSSLKSMDDPTNDHQDKERITSELMSNYFIENMGQIPEEDHCFYSTSGNVHFLPDDVLMRFRELEPIYSEVEEPLHDPFEERMPEAYHDKGVVLKYSFVDANEVIPIGRERCSWNTNYFKGSDPDHWYTDVPNYKEILYENVWEGIDIIYKLKDGNVKYDIVLSPGADPSLIKLRIDGHKDLSIDMKGDLVVGTEYWDIIDSGLVAFYKDFKHEMIDVEFQIIEDNVIGFLLGPYDGEREIVIDPLTYSTFIGGSDNDQGRSIVVDSNDNAYLTGFTFDTTTDYPTTNGSFNKTHNGKNDVFVTKLNPTGSSLIYSTFIGGSDYDTALSIAGDTNGNAFITGVASNDSTDYPTTNGAYDTTHNGKNDVFVTKLNPTGSSLIYSTFIGGSESDTGYSIVIDSIGNSYITGSTYSSNYPTTNGAYDTTHNGNSDVFVTKLNSLGSSLIYSTFVGGKKSESGNSISIDSNGNTYITGGTETHGEVKTSYPTTVGAYDTTYNGNYDVFVTKLNSTGSSLVYSTFIGNYDIDQGMSISVDSYGNSYIAGYTFSSNYPTTNGAYDTTYNGDSDVFVTKLNSNGSSLIYSTFIGCSDKELGRSISVDLNGNVFITGYTGDYTGDATHDYPVTNGAYDTTYNGFYDVFVTKLNFTGSSLDYSTFIGGSDRAFGNSIAVDLNGDAYITGYTGRTPDYPTTNGSYDTTHNGDYDIFVTKLSMVSDSIPPMFINDFTLSTMTTGEFLTFNVEVTDNTAVEEVYVEYWFEDCENENETMAFDSKFTYSIQIPSDSLLELHYKFHAFDTHGNGKSTIEKKVSVLDNDKPALVNGTSDDVGTTGDPFKFHVSLRDNIGIDHVTVEYWFGESGDHENISMDGTGPHNLTILIPYDSLDELNYIFHFNDTSDNWNQTEIINIMIFDNDRPEFIEDKTPTTVTAGSEITFSIEVIDNIAIHNVILEYWFGDGNHETINMISEGAFYKINLTTPSKSTEPAHYFIIAMDLSGLSNTTETKIVLVTKNNDNDGDGIPNLVEKENGLDMNSSSDASMDPDEDGLTNLEEYLNNTEMNNDDSDNDGMPDGWEIDNGLDALKPSANLDSDKDGKTDLEEYLDGTDPNKDTGDTGPNGEEIDGQGALIWIGVLIVLIIVLIVSLCFIVFLLKRGRKSVETPIESPIIDEDQTPSQPSQDSSPAMNDNVDIRVQEVPEEPHITENANVPVLETPLDQLKLVEEDILDQEVPELSTIPLEEPPVEELISEEESQIPLNETPIQEDASLKNATNQAD